MRKERVVSGAVSYEYPPDGGSLPVIDPYDGCTIGCPYCFQLEDEAWNACLDIKLNIADILPGELARFNKEDTIYIGSRCDPYMEVERSYQLTRQCLVEISRLQIRCMVTTKAGTELIVRDLDVIESMGERFTLLLGLSNLQQLRQIEDYSLISNIQTANLLHRRGIRVWAFITPILPGITDVDRMIHALDPGIPVYLDKLRVNSHTRPAQRLESFIRTEYPHLENTYQEIIYQNNDPYYEAIRKKWYNDERVHFVFG